MTPSKIAQNDDGIPSILNGVAATAKATKAPNRQEPLNALCKLSCMADRIASPARVTTKLRGKAVSSDATDAADRAIVSASPAAIKFAQ